MRNGYLILEDGKFWKGFISSVNKEVLGEIVFYTGVVGYQEVITDPSYYGKIVVMTYPHIGNYGINPAGFVSKNICIKGLVVKELSKISTNWASIKNFLEFSQENGIFVLENVDTQEITSYIRENGVKKAILTIEKLNKNALSKKFELFDTEEDKVKYVSCKSPYKVGNGSFKIVAIDLGILEPHLNILSNFSEVIVVPYEITSEEILSYKPDGIFISSGPGSPLPLEKTINEVKKIIGKKPIFGIGLGMLVLSLSLGFNVFKMKTGHYGINQPVKDLIKRKNRITTQAHLYNFSLDFLEKEINVWFTNINDSTVEGIVSEDFKIIGVNFYPTQDDDIWIKFKEFLNAEKK
ncbi:MAG: glutamine-hydrolyzing carbamoyl-phosphate synthase small subunit [Candidatus Omnitrophica bacterium]|nr:glutamine-hydrolyzing carbamoyl-phosphate synthase small subunit [Candidatus Omnitrophota bacterium]